MSRRGDANSARLPTQREAGQASAATQNEAALIATPDAAALIARTDARPAALTPCGSSPSAICLSPSRQTT
jgi:hypothetical protein